MRNRLAAMVQVMVLASCDLVEALGHCKWGGGGGGAGVGIGHRDCLGVRGKALVSTEKYRFFARLLCIFTS